MVRIAEAATASSPLSCLRLISRQRTSRATRSTCDMQLSAELDGVPREAAVYELLRDEPTVETVTEIAEKLGIEGDVEDQGDGSFTASGNGDLFVTIDQIQYFSTVEVAEGDLPSDVKAISEARDWLRHTSPAPRRISAKARSSPVFRTRTG